MNGRRKVIYPVHKTLVAICMIAAAGPALALAQVQEGEKETPARVMRFDGVGEHEENGNRFMALWGFDPMDRWSIDIIKYQVYVPIPNSDGHVSLPPAERLMGRLRKVKKGDLIDVYTSANGLLTRIEMYDALPGEDMPDSAIFVQLTTEKREHGEFPAVVIRKFGRDRTYPIARMDESGKWVPDESLATRVRTLTQGALVEIDLRPEEPNVLRMGMQYFATSMLPYTLPQVGTIAEVKKETDRDPSTVLLTLTIEGKERPAGFYYEGPPTLEVGQEVWFRPTNKNGKDWLKFVWWKKD